MQANTTLNIYLIQQYCSGLNEKKKNFIFFYCYIIITMINSTIHVLNYFKSLKNTVVQTSGASKKLI